MTLSPITLRPDVGVGLIIVVAGVAFTRQGELHIRPTHARPHGAAHDALCPGALQTAWVWLQVLCFWTPTTPTSPSTPYPTHGVIGTGEELMDPLLTRWRSRRAYTSSRRTASTLRGGD
ncbi:MAG: hypothetical protein IPN01_22145 [Deltaproteobacteria bacterium]|nr:hypothetical protein [Deltaproteobacteria bacterium]